MSSKPPTHGILQAGDASFVGPESRKPLLKWAGGKRWLVPRIAEIYGNHREKRFVEPMCGGMAITLGLVPERALLGDVNPHLINFYRWVKEGLSFTLVMENEKSLFYQYRARFNSLVSSGNHESKEAAELFYYLNRTCYNGLCRFNRSGEFNVPFGRYGKINYSADFLSYRDTFATWEFSHGSYLEQKISAGDFVYLDPPYDVQFTNYSGNGFTWRDQVELAMWASNLDVPVVISNQATERIVELYSSLGFQIEYTMAPRAISCNGNRDAAREVIATMNT